MNRFMNGAWGLLAGAVVCSLVAGGCATAEKPALPTIAWKTSMSGALADAGKNGRPILLDFYTDWCDWCKVLDESTYTDSTVIEFAGHFTCLKLNAEVDTVSAARYHVRSYPTILILKPDGTEIDRVVGFYHAPDFIERIKDYIAGRNTLVSLVAAESAQSRDPGFVARLADRYFEHGLYPEARLRYSRLVSMDPFNKSDLVDDALMTLARMSRKERDYVMARKFAQMVLDRYPDSDVMKSAFLEVGINRMRSGDLAVARKIFLDYVDRYPGDEDVPYATEQADTLAVRIARKSGS